MQHDIFISYSSKDLDVVKPIKEELEAMGWSKCLKFRLDEDGVMIS